MHQSNEKRAETAETPEEAAGPQTPGEETATKDEQIETLRGQLAQSQAQVRDLMQRVAQAERYERVAWRRLSDLTEALTQAQAKASFGGGLDGP